MTTLFHRTGVRRNWRRAYLIELAFGLIVLAGCQTTPPAPTVDLAPLSTQIGNLSSANSDLAAANARLKAANEALAAENARLLAMLRADADAGRAANAKGWVPFERYVWGHQIALLPGIVPDKATSDRWSEASNLYAAGGESAMQGVIDTLNADAAKTNETLGTLREQVDALTKERDTANEATKRALERVQEAEQSLAAAVEQTRRDEAARIARETREWQIHAANWAGGGLFVATLGLAAAAWFIPISRRMFGEGAIVAMALCVGCFAFARLLGNPLFLPVACGAYGVGLLGWAAWKVRSGMREREAEESAKAAVEKADRYTAWGASVVPAIDDIYEDKSVLTAWIANWKSLHPGMEPTQSDYIEARLFDPLSASQDANIKRVVDEIRSSVKLAKSDEAL